MKTAAKYLRIQILAIAAVGTMSPQTLWAKSPGGGGGGGISASHMSSSSVGHVDSGNHNKTNTPSSVGPAPSIGAASGLSAKQLKTTSQGTLATDKFSQSRMSTNGNATPVFGDQIADHKNNSPFGKNSAPQLSTIGSGRTDQLISKDAGKFIPANSPGNGIFQKDPVAAAKAGNSMNNLPASNLKTSVVGKSPITVYRNDLSLGPIPIPSPSDIVDGAVALGKGVVNVGTGGIIASGGNLLIQPLIASSHVEPGDSPDPAASQVINPNVIDQNNLGKVDKTVLTYTPTNFQTSVTGGGIDRVGTSQMKGKDAALDTGLMNIPLTPGNMGTGTAGKFPNQIPPLGKQQTGPAVPINPPASSQHQMPTPFPFPSPSSGSMGGGETGSAGSTADTSAPDTSTATTSSTATAVASDAIATNASTDAAKPVATGADLVLEDVKLAAPATLVAGPAYTVKFRNQGTEAAAKFQVAVLAGLEGKLGDNAPRAAVEVKSLAAGESREVTLRLPQSALKLNDANNKPAMFTHLFVAVDLMNTVGETDESNNTAVLERAALEGSLAN